MKKIILTITFALIGLVINQSLYAQCPAGETEVTIQFTDAGTFPGEIQWDYIAGGIISGLGPFLVTDVVTVCVADGNLLIIGCDTFGDGWNGAEYIVTITEDGSVNGCGTQDGCILYISNDTDDDTIPDCDDNPIGTPAGPTLTVGPCDASPILTTGCTDPAATNYNACATTDDGTCLVPTANNDCANAEPLTIGVFGDCPANEFFVNNITNTVDITPSCDIPSADLFYSFAVPASGSIQFFAGLITGGSVHAAIYDSCGGTELYCNTFIDGDIVGGLTPGDNLILQLWQATPGEFNLCVAEPPPPSTNNECVNAEAITVGSLADCATNTVTVLNTSNFLELVPSCDTGAAADAFYSVVVPPSGNIQISAPFGTGGSAHAAIYDACGGAELYCNTFVDGDIVPGLPVGATVILQMFQDTAGQFDLCLIEPPPPPTNDLCVDAIQLCGETLSATNASAFTDAADPLTTCIGSLENTVWFSFVAAGGGTITIDVTEGICDAFSPGLQTHILSGPCGGPYTEEDCTSTFTAGTTYTLNLLGAIPGDTYYLYIDGNGGSNCSFDIDISGDFQPCCGPDFSLSPACQLGDSDNFYVEVQVNDIGDNPSGYSVNGGAFPNITTTGNTTIGPFPNGIVNIIFEGLDDATCILTREIEFDCSCDPLAVTASDDITICAGESTDLSATLEEVIPGGFLGTYTVTSNGAGSCTATPNGAATDVILTDDDFGGPFPLGFNFDFWGNTYTDFYISSNGYVTFGMGFTDLGEDPIPNTNTPNDIIALFWDDLDPGDGGTVSYFDAIVNGQNCMVVEFNQVIHCCTAPNETVTGQIIMCEDGSVTINCIDCQTDGGTDTATSGIENTDGTAGAFDPALTAGQFTTGGSYMACTTFVPDVAVPSTCDFVYWITDLSDPAGSIVFSGDVATVSPSITTTYYAVVECQDQIQCIDEVVVTIDDPVNCGGTCEDEIAGQVIAPFDCDLTGITVVISIINADGSETIIGNATTDMEGNYTLPGGPYACGNYSAMLMLPLPDCYADAGGNTGPTGPINFTVDGDGVADGANFAVNAEIPTLSQWGLIILALLLMNFGALNLIFKRRKTYSIFN